MPLNERALNGMGRRPERTYAWSALKQSSPAAEKAWTGQF
jgi:hypothetical protein